MVLHASRAHPEYRHQVQPAISSSALQLLTRQPRCPWWNVRWVVRTFPAAAPPWRTFLQMQEGEIMYLTRRARGVKCARGDASNYGVRRSVRRFWFWNALFRTHQGVGVVNCCWQFLSSSSIYLLFFAMVLLKGFPWVRGGLGHLKLDFRFFFFFFSNWTRYRH